MYLAKINLFTTEKLVKELWLLMRGNTYDDMAAWENQDIPRHVGMAHGIEGILDQKERLIEWAQHFPADTYGEQSETVTLDICAHCGAGLCHVSRQRGQGRCLGCGRHSALWRDIAGALSPPLPETALEFLEEQGWKFDRSGWNTHDKKECFYSSHEGKVERMWRTISSIVGGEYPSGEVDLAHLSMVFDLFFGHTP